MLGFCFGIWRRQIPMGALLPGQLGNRGTGASRGACGSGSAYVGVMSIMSWGPRWYLRLIGQPLGLAAALGPQGNPVEVLSPPPGVEISIRTSLVCALSKRR